jgi:hypothetical protein
MSLVIVVMYLIQSVDRTLYFEWVNIRLCRAVNEGDTIAVDEYQ